MPGTGWTSADEPPAHRPWRTGTTDPGALDLTHEPQRWEWDELVLAPVLAQRLPRRPPPPTTATPGALKGHIFLQPCTRPR